jgi:CDP-diacylglycerol--glycerol-3-phosphate 3-phosphatidyltransferase
VGKPSRPAPNVEDFTRATAQSGYASPAMAPTGSSSPSDGPGHDRRADGEPPRVRDVPAPRRNQSFIGPLFRTLFAWPYRWALTGLYRAGFRPWQLTLLSLVANVAVGWLLVTGRFLISSVVLLVAGLLDVFDGGVARLRGEDSRRGAFLDSVLDRVSDVILFGALFWALAGQDRRLGAGLALVGLIVSLLVSYIRAEAEALGLRLSEGLMQRLERYVALMIGLMVPGALVPVLFVLAAMGTVTVVQRLVSAWTQLARKSDKIRSPS